MPANAKSPSSAPRGRSPTTSEYQQAVEFGQKIVEAGFMVITGAGSGIMQAGHEGAGPENSFGVNIRLPWEQSANPDHRRRQETHHLQIFFHAQTHFHPPLGRDCPVPRRLRHVGRRLRGAHAHADRQEPAHAARAGGQTRRHLLENVGHPTSANNCCATN